METVVPSEEAAYIVEMAPGTVCDGSFTTCDQSILGGLWGFFCFLNPSQEELASLPSRRVWGFRLISEVWTTCRDLSRSWRQGF